MIICLSIAVAGLEGFRIRPSVLQHLKLYNRYTYLDIIIDASVDKYLFFFAYYSRKTYIVGTHERYVSKSKPNI